MPFEDEIPPGGGAMPMPANIEDLCKRVIGVAIHVHRELGPGLPESGYENALAHEFTLQHIAYRRQHRIPIRYKDVVVATVRLDFLIEDKLVLEVKSCDSFTPIDRRQVLRYLQVLRLPLGLLINFNVMVLKEGIRRVI